MAISLNNLELTDFRSFVGTHVLNFNEKGLCLVNGENKDAGGQNGSGKSSILLAIGYLIGNCPFSAKDLKTWLNDSPMSVKGTFSTPDGPLVITRGTKRLDLSHKGQTISGKDVEKEIDHIFGINAAMRSVLTYRPQGEPGFFLALSDGDKKTFLTELLGLQSFELAIEASNDTIKELQSKLSERNGQVLSCQAMYDESVKSDVPFDAPSHEKQIGLLTDKLKVEEINLKSLKAVKDALYRKRKEELSSLQHTTEESVSVLERKMEALRAVPVDHSINDLEEKFQSACKRLDALKAADKAAEAEMFKKTQDNVHQRNKALERISLFTQKIIELKAQNSDLEKGKCYVCSSAYADSLEKAQENRDTIKGLEDECTALQMLVAQCNATRFTFEPNPNIELLKAARDKLFADKTAKALDAENALEKTLAPLKTQISEKRSDMFNTAQAIGYKFDSDLTKVGAECDASAATYAKFDKELGNCKAQYKTLQEAHALSQKRIKHAKDTLDQHKANQAEIVKQLNAEMDCLDVLKGFLDRIFHEVLAQIAQEANQMMGSIPNISHLSIDFKTEKLTAKGIAKQTITPVVMFRGNERPLKSGASGGMYRSVELCVDWAVLKIISERTGCKLNWLSIDEGFDGLDKNNKAACLEVMQRIAADKLVLVVDHSSEVQESFGQVINILHRNERSVIVQP